MLIAWENEAFLALQEFGADKFEIVVPSLSILAEPPVAVVDGNVDAERHPQGRGGLLSSSTRRPGRRSSPRTSTGRSTRRPPRRKTSHRFPKLQLVTIDADFGGWTKAQATHFADGGIFDQI